MSLIFANNGVFPLFASEPSIQEFGYRSRYNVQSTYGEIKPSVTPSKPSVYSFSDVNIPGCKEKQDWVALLCMGTTPQTVPAKYMDRSRLVTDNISVTFEGTATYRYSGGAVTRDPIRFFTTRQPRILPRITVYNIAGVYTHTIDPSILYVDITLVGGGGGVPVLSAINPAVFYAARGGGAGSTVKIRMTKAQFTASRTLSIGVTNPGLAGGQTGLTGIAIANGGNPGGWVGGAFYPGSYSSGVGPVAGFSLLLTAAQGTVLSTTNGAGAPDISMTARSTPNPVITLTGGNGASSTVGIGAICTQLALPGPLVSSASNVQQPVSSVNPGSGAAGGALWLGGALPTVIAKGGEGLVIFEEYYS